MTTVASEMRTQLVQTSQRLHQKFDATKLGEVVALTDPGGSALIVAGTGDPGGLGAVVRRNARHVEPLPRLAWTLQLLALAYDDRVTDAARAPAFEVAGRHIVSTICLGLSYPGELSDNAVAAGIIVKQSNIVVFEGERVREQFLNVARARADTERTRGDRVEAGPTAAIDSE